MPVLIVGGIVLLLTISSLGSSGLAMVALMVIVFGVAAMEIQDIWDGRTFLYGVTMALICYVAAFVFYLANCVSGKNIYVFYIAYTVLLIVGGIYLHREKKRNETDIQDALRVLSQTAADFSHFLPDRYRFLNVYYSTEEQMIVVRMSIVEADTERMIYREIQQNNVPTYHHLFFGDYEPSNFAFRCYDLLEEGREDEIENALSYTWPLHGKNMNTLPYLAKAMKKEYPQNFKASSLDSSFHLTFS